MSKSAFVTKTELIQIKLIKTCAAGNGDLQASNNVVENNIIELLKS